RGVYRIFGLEPGSYVVRAATKQYDEGGYLPTFFNNVATVEGARPVEVLLDQDTPDVLIRPAPGRLYHIAGSVYGSGRTQIMLTLISDMGTESVSPDSDGRYKFSPVAPGKYEIYAQGFGGRAIGMLAAYQPLEIDRDQTETNLSLRPQPEVQFVFEDTKGAPVDSSSVQIMARQKQLSGDLPVQFIRPANNRQSFDPGRWEFSLAPNAGFYVVGDHQVLLREASTVVKFVLSTSPAAIHGTVQGAPGIRVYLEGRPGEIRTTRTDMNGQFRFSGLAPGDYRIQSTFDAYNAYTAQKIHLDEGQELEMPGSR
ncbi:MAG TPA: carboxypeptidase-like regulatory domain-containing protein, partial [Candidatus Sulfopaludibacter sp.]|nr:carboxypeptidase-like regulatory domain-containing protein [Candidatus Sulfopaludibacter sp.]